MKPALFIAQAFLLLALTTRLGFSAAVPEAVTISPRSDDDDEDATQKVLVEDLDLSYNPYAAKNLNKTAQEMAVLLKNYEGYFGEIEKLQQNPKPFPNVLEAVNSNAEYKSLKANVESKPKCATKLSDKVQQLVKALEDKLRADYNGKIEELYKKTDEIKFIVYVASMASGYYSEGLPADCAYNEDCVMALTALKQLKVDIQLLETAKNPDGEYFKEIYNVNDLVASEVKSKLVPAVNECSK